MSKYKFGDVLIDKTRTPDGQRAIVMVISARESESYDKFQVIGLTDRGRTGYHTGKIGTAYDVYWDRHE